MINASSIIASLAKWLTPSQKRETYENDWTRSVTIHRTWCGHLRKHGGSHAYNQGRYVKHETIDQAISYAESTGFVVNMCLSCHP